MHNGRGQNSLASWGTEGEKPSLQPFSRVQALSSAGLALGLGHGCHQFVSPCVAGLLLPWLQIHRLHTCLRQPGVTPLCSERATTVCWSASVHPREHLHIRKSEGSFLLCSYRAPPTRLPAQARLLFYHVHVQNLLPAFPWQPAISLPVPGCQNAFLMSSWQSQAGWRAVVSAEAGFP